MKYLVEAATRIVDRHLSAQTNLILELLRNETISMYNK